jgi:hypothetical protein
MGKTAHATKPTIFLHLMPRLRMSAAVGLHGVHRHNVSCISHSLSRQDKMVAVTSEVLKLLLLKGRNFSSFIFVVFI